MSIDSSFNLQRTTICKTDDLYGNRLKPLPFSYFYPKLAVYKQIIFPGLSQKNHLFGILIKEK